MISDKNVYQLDQVQRDLGQSFQAKYLFNYVKVLGAETVVVEESYVDKDSLIDYSKFYARSFTPYERFTKRLHFFSHSFSLEDFREVLENHNVEHLNKIKKAYLGFIVVKPIRDLNGNPLIGRTILELYPHRIGKESRNFIEREYSAYLYGIKLTVKSLPFQVQDIAVGACATTALWISLHPLCDLFGIPMQSPAEITEKSASVPTEYRSFPSSGLTLEQIITYIKSTGLDTESIDIESKKGSEIGKHIVPDAVRAYIKLGLAPIATIKLKKNENIVDRHAAVISGYRCNKNGVIRELYVHDDQIGPFSRVESDGSFMEWKNEWNLKFGYEEASVEKLIVPIYPKIRLTFGRIYEVYLREKRTLSSQGLGAELFLTQVREYKEFLWNREIEDKEMILTKPLPRFLWIIRFHLGGKPLIDDVYDGTSVFPTRLLPYVFYKEFL